eukprot:3467000-Rhodomonas_salina.8
MSSYTFAIVGKQDNPLYELVQSQKVSPVSPLLADGLSTFLSSRGRSVCLSLCVSICVSISVPASLAASLCPCLFLCPSRPVPLISPPTALSLCMPCLHPFDLSFLISPFARTRGKRELFVLMLVACAEGRSSSKPREPILSSCGRPSFPPPCPSTLLHLYFLPICEGFRFI